VVCRPRCRCGEGLLEPRGGGGLSRRMLAAAVVAALLLAAWLVL
jgi:hypothetical protein